MWEQVANGAQSELVQLAQYENLIPEGVRGKLVLTLSTPVPSGEVNKLQTVLDNLGVTAASVSSSSNQISITFRKGFPWLAVIVGAILGLIVLAILIVSWQLFKESPIAFNWTIALLIGGLALVAVVILVIMFRRGGSP